MGNEEDEAPAAQSPTLREVAVGLCVSIAAGLIVCALVQILRWLSLHNPILLLCLAFAIVVGVLIFYGLKTSRRPWFWYMPSAVLVLTGFLLFRSTVLVPKVVGMALGDAKATVIKTGLIPHESEMVKGGSNEVVLQVPSPGSRRFRGSPVKLFFGQLPSVSITEPRDGGTVAGYRATVRGTCSGVHGSSDFYIRVIVRPQDNHVWVTDPPLVRSDGTFEVEAYFGEPDVGQGEEYRVLAIVTTEALSPGDLGTEIPKYVACSEVIKVTRER